MNSVVILGTGVHPWGRWEYPFLDYACAAARSAIEESGVGSRDIGFVAAAGSVRCGYPGYVAAAVISRRLGLCDVESITSYGACTSGAQALAVARDRILSGGCEVALVVGADLARPSGEGAAADGKHAAPPIPNHAWLGLRATRRMHEFGTTLQDLSQVRVKNSTHGAANKIARFRLPLSARDIAKSRVVASPLHLLHISTYSDGAAALVIASEEYSRRHCPSAVRIRSIALSVLPDEGLEMPYLSGRWPESRQGGGRTANVARALGESGVSPEELSAVELYDVSSVSELDWYEHIGLCRVGDAERLLQSGATALGGRIPVNASGGLTSFGEAVAAQALLQVCELTWQLQGRCQSRQVEGARTGLAVCDGMYGHVASVVVST